MTCRVVLVSVAMARRRAPAALLAMLMLACAPAASAATLTWSATGTSSAIGGTGTWDTSALRWTANGSTWSAWSNAGIDTAVFAGTAGTVTLNTGITAGGLSFITTGYTLTGGTLTLASSGTLPTITAATGVTGTIASMLAGTGGLVMAGSGTMVLTSANTYTGTTSVNGGVLQIGAGGTVGSVSGSSPLALGGGTLFVNRSDAVTQSFAGTTLRAGASSGTATATATVDFGAITRNTGATLNIAATGTFITSSANTNGILPGITYGGTTWAVSGTTTAISGLAAGSYTTTTTAGATAGNYASANIDVDSSAGTLSGVIAPNTLRFNSAGTRTVTLAAGGASTVPSGILVTATVGNNASTITGGTLAGSSGGDLAVIQNNTSNTLTISSVIADNTTATGLTKSGTGTLVLTAANTYTGATQINAGTLQIGAGATAGSITTSSTIAGAAGATLAFNRTDTLTQGSQFTLAAGSPLNLSQLGSGTLVLNVANSYTGTTTIGNNGTVVFNASQATTGPLVLGASAGASTLGSLNLGAASGTFGGLLVQTNASGTNRITIGSGQTLATNGDVYVYGSNGGTTNLTVAGTTSGVGAWTITNPLASGTFLVGGNATVGNPGNITVDLSSLGTFSANLSGASSLFRIGWSFNQGSDNMILRLAVSSTITANRIGVGDAGQAGNTPYPVLSLGSGVQRLNTDSLNVAQTNNARSGGSVVFTGSTGSVVLRAQNGTGRSNVLMTAPSTSTSTPITGTIDFRGHDADLLIGGLTMTSITSAGINASYSSTFSFDQGTLDVTSGTLGFSTTGNLVAATPNATLNLGSGSNTAVNTTTMGSLWMATSSAGNTLATVNVAGVNTSVTVTGSWRLASNTSTGGTATGVLNISGGTVNANRGIILRNGNGSAGPVNGTISITGGALVSGSDITSVGTFAAGAAVLTLDGGRLDMGGFAIGGSGQTVTGTFLSGTLSSLGQYNNGGTFTKSGTGTLVLTGSNTYTGTTSITAGTLQVGAGGTTGSLGASNAITGSAGATLAANRSDTITLGGVISGSLNVTQLGSGTLVLSGNNTFTGTTSITAGALRIGGSGQLGGGSFSGPVINGSVLDYASSANQTLSGAISGTGAVLKTGAGALVLSASNSFAGGLTVSAGTLRIGDAAALGTGTVTLSGGALSSDGATARTIANAVSVTGNVTLGDATNSGVLSFTGGVDLGDGTRTLTTPSSVSIASVISGAGSLTKSGAGTLTLSAANTYAGATTISAGTFALSGAGDISSGSAALVSIAAGGVLDISGASGARTIGALSDGDGSSRVLLGGNSLRSVVAPANASFGGVISGSGGFTKAGGDQLELTNIQAFTGAATVEAGNLLLASGTALASASRIYVAAGASIETYAGQALTILDKQTLGGYGTVSGDLALLSGGTLSPGGSVGTLYDSGATTWYGGMHYLFEVNDATGTPGLDPGWDLFSTAGDLTLSITGNDQIFVDLTSLNGSSSGSAANFDPGASYAWKFAVANSAIAYEYSQNPTWFKVETGAFQNSTNGSFYVARGDTVTGGSEKELYVVYAGVPEPGTLALAAIGLAATGLAAARGRARRGGSGRSIPAE